MDKYTSPSTSGTTPPPLPKGVVLDKDGKPCRTCTDTAAWRALTRPMKPSTSNSGSSSSSSSSAAPSIASATTAATALSTSLPQEQEPRTRDCPPDVQELGRSTWTLLHSLAATYPRLATPEQKSDMNSFLGLFAKLYPCWVCAEDFQAWISREKPVLEGRKGFGDWMCRAHNEVNRKLGKKEFDCGTWEERWRTGWKDGSCD